MDNCLFCKIVKGDIPCYKIYEDDFVLAFLDIACDAEGHTLVVPKKHFENMLDADETYLNSVLSACKKISKHYVENCGFEGVNIVNNSGEVAGQTVMHLHFHIIPRKNNDKLNVWQLCEKREMNLGEVAQKLKLN